MRVVLSDTAPGEPVASWEDVVEVSTVVPPGAGAGWSSWAGESGGDLDGLAPGTYRLRASARGRDAGRDGEFADGPVDAYLLQLWPRHPHPMRSCGSAAATPSRGIASGAADAVRDGSQFVVEVERGAAEVVLVLRCLRGQEAQQDCL